MSRFLIFLLLFQIAIFYSVFAQISEDFSDGNFTVDPIWIGDDSNFIVNPEGQLQLNAPAEAGKSYLSTSSEINQNAEWTFFVKLEFNPSSNNYIDIYLVSDNADLSGPINGYFVRIGNTQDEVSLYKQSGDKSTQVKIIDGMDDRVDINEVKLNIKVSKNHENLWELFIDTNLDQTFISEGVIMDSEHLFSKFFGIYCTYSSTRSTKFFFDNLSISGDVYTDTEAPKVDSILALSDSSIQLFFNEKMMLSTIENIDSYFVNNGIGSPSTVNANSDTSAILSFTNKFDDALKNQISIHGVEDLSGNSLDNHVMSFTYFAPYILSFGDILITEIMADPTPGVDLPEYEYLEIFNPKNEIFDLRQVRLIVGNDTTTIPDLTIHPGEYIILCQHSAVPHFEMFGRTVKITNWPSLNNQGEQIILLNAHEEIVVSINYNNAWYKSIEKDNGGYSLEMIDTNYPCKDKENWTASADPSGGTPGKENSVINVLTDLSAPEIEKIIAVSNSSLSIVLNENISPQKINIDDISLTPNLTIDRIELLQPNFSEIWLDLIDEISPKTVYELTMKNLSDCAGNMQKSTSSTFVLPESADSLDLIINELLFNPLSGGVDFVEIYNQSEKYIDLSSISLHSDGSEPISEAPFIIEPKQLLAMTEDPILLNNQYPGIDMKNVLKSMNVPAYNDDQGDVVLVNIHGNPPDRQAGIIDFFHYEEDYHSSFLNETEGVSLERISFTGPSNDPDNWQSAASTAGYATPGEMNSQFLMSENEGEEIIIDPLVFDPGNNGFHDFTTIKCRFLTPGNMATILILDPIGRQIKSIISHQSIAAEENFKWEGLDDNGKEVRMGPYIVYVEVYNSSGFKKSYRKKVVVGGQF